MGRIVWIGLLIGLVFCSETRLVHAAARRSELQQGQSGGEQARQRVRSKRHTAEDSALVLLFGVGLFGCASVCAVESHREERRRQAHEDEHGLPAPTPA